MPEYPDITIYKNALAERVVGQPLRGIRLTSVFLLRSAEPPLSAFTDQTVTGVSNIGKRIVLRFEDIAEPEGPLFLVLHLMIAGRLHWKKPGTKPHGRNGLCAFDFDDGTLTLTEASKKKRAKLHAVRGLEGLEDHAPGGIEVLDATRAQFGEALTRNNHTLKRALTDPRLLSGIGNAFSDEILLEAKLSPIKLTQKLSAEEIDRLYAVSQQSLIKWTDLLESQRAGKFPEKVTAFRPEMGAHGKYGEPCPQCGTAIQRIKYSSNETNYCPTCQTGGKLLADRAMSRLLKKDWPKTLEELEELKREHGKAG
jgi:formamidopyrimidine-DNA glycosylase